MAFFTQMMELKDTLENMGFIVHTPILEGSGTDYSLLTESEQRETKNKFINKHLDKIKESHAILVANYDKKGIEGYIGANTFIEMAFAYALNKKIYILKSIPDQDNKIEIMGLLPICLKEDVQSLVAKNGA